MKITSLLFFSYALLLAMSGPSLAETDFERFRRELKQEKPVQNSYITDSKKSNDSEPVSLQEHISQFEADCRINKKSPRCLEFRKLPHTSFLAQKEACDRDPLGRRCQSFKETARRRLQKRQSACRAGLNSRKCIMLRSSKKFQ